MSDSTSTMSRVYGVFSERNRKHASVYGDVSPQKTSVEAPKKSPEPIAQSVGITGNHKRKQ